MGQRFQIFGVTSNYKGETFTYGYHLQWCWGHYTISRLHQMLKYGEADCKSDYSDLRKSFNGYEIEQLLQSLVSLNIHNNSFVYADNLERDNKTLGKYESPFVFDNNDGVFVIDFRHEKPKFALFAHRYDEATKKCYFQMCSSLSYMQEYYGKGIKAKLKESLCCDTDSEFEEEYNAYMNMINYIDTFDVLSEKDMDNIFPNIDKEYVSYEIF